MNVAGDPRPGGLPDIHPKIDSIWPVELPQHGLHPLRKRHHFVGGVNGQLPQFVQMSVGHDHHMARRVRICIQNDETMLAAVHDVRLGVVLLLRRVAKHAHAGLLQWRRRRRNAKESRGNP